MLSSINSTIWRRIDTLGPQLSPATCQSCKDQKAALELRRTYDFLTQLRDEFEPPCALLARHPWVFLLDALVEVCNEETLLRDASSLRSSSVLAVHSSVACPVAPVPLASAPVANFVTRGESADLHCDHCG
jgi:hypothetical protein